MMRQHQKAKQLPPKGKLHHPSGDSLALSVLCRKCGDRLSREALKPSELLRCTETDQAALKDEAGDCWKNKKHEHKGQKQLGTEATTSLDVCTESIEANHIAKELYTVILNKS